MPGLAIEKQSFDYSGFFAWIARGTKRSGYAMYRRMSHQHRRHIKALYERAKPEPVKESKEAEQTILNLEY